MQPQTGGHHHRKQGAERRLDSGQSDEGPRGDWNVVRRGKRNVQHYRDWNDTAACEDPSARLCVSSSGKGAAVAPLSIYNGVSVVACGGYSCSYTDRKEGPQVYTLLPSPQDHESVKGDSVKVATASRHKAVAAKPCDVLGEKESSNPSALTPRQQELALLPASASLKQVLRFCLKASHSTHPVPLREDELQALAPFSLHPYQVKGVQWLLTSTATGRTASWRTRWGWGRRCRCSPSSPTCAICRVCRTHRMGRAQRVCRAQRVRRTRREWRVRRMCRTRRV